MNTAQRAQNRKHRLFLDRQLHILMIAAGLARAVSTQAEGVYFQNSYGLVSPSNIVAFSEFSPPPNTIIATQYQAYGVTFVPYVHYASIYDQTSGTPHIDPAACVANFVQYGPVVPTFSVVFGRPVSAAAFAVLSQAGTFQVTALMVGTEIPGGPHTFTGGFGPDRTTNFVGFSDVMFDELRISNIATSDGALVLDNLQFTPALVNSWTNPASARWDSSTNWSFGTLPASNQTVSIANEGYKAVNIDSATFANFPASVTVSNLFVAAPTNALSTLLLNYAGLNAPLKVLNNCTIGPNGTIANFSSSFEVDGDAAGQLDVGGGTFTQVGGLTVVNAPVSVRSGSLNATNGNLTLGDLTLGTTNSGGSFNQDGGSVAAQHLSLQNGTYSLASGILYAIGGTQLRNNGTFNQSGGTNYGDITMYGGHYNLMIGMVQGNLFSVQGGPQQQGNFLMNGGVLDMQKIDWSDQDGWYLSGYFRHGSVRCGSFNIAGSAYVYVEVADVLVTNNVDLHDGATLETGFCHLRASTVTLYGTNTYNPTFWQGGGIIPPPETNIISSGLTMYGGRYILAGGTLQTPYIGVGSNARIAQEGGLNLVQGVLSISGQYEATGGDLVTEGLYLRGSMLLWGPPTGAVTFTNTGLLDLGGSLGIGLTNAWGGQVRLSTNAAISFIGSPPHVQLRFAASSDVPWTPGALLVITNWNNSGAVHLFFGNEASTLTTSQLAQIQFANPGGFQPGQYPAQLLSTGELVPTARPTLQMARTGSALVLSWAGYYQLLSATNVAGPFSPVPGASTPWTNLFSNPQEFFTLRSF